MCQSWIYRCYSDWDDICRTLDLNAHIPKPLSEEKEVKGKDEEKKAEKEGDTILDDKEKVIFKGHCFLESNVEFIYRVAK